MRTYIFLTILTLFLVTFFVLSYRSPSTSSLLSTNFIDGKFRNINLNTREITFFKVTQFLIFEKWGKWPKWIENNKHPKLQTSNDEIVITFINHATFLAEVKGTRILFDPIFSHTAGPLKWVGVNRKREPAISIEELPPIDLILVSHNHYDHLDLPSLKQISAKFSPKIIVPLGDKNWLEEKGLTNVTEMDWWQTKQSNEQLKIHFVPAQHGSGRTLLDHDKGLWGGFVVEHNDITLFHAGDTGYAQHFKEISNKFKIDIAMLPIGDYKPQNFLQYVHMNPHEAVQAHKDLQAKKSFAMHSETFPLSGVSYLEAEEELNKALTTAGDNIDFTKLELGESYRIINAWRQQAGY